MLNLIGKHIKFSKANKTYLKGINLSTGKSWDIATEHMKSIKKRINTHLVIEQRDLCAYCSCRLNVGGRAEIEHIAPKGKTLYPEFTFNERNLILVCQHCNSSTKKGRMDPVTKRSKYYGCCEFSIVHPHFDDPDEHYQWANGVKICIISKSAKATKSIKVFKLDCVYLTEQRAKDLQSEKWKQKIPLSPLEEAELDKALQLLP
ncbi:retron system putative HNH endonuclease [Peribacillus butanolivorans]|uniref:retron system putative HNH endonuclease n=1 Tax=Peribacillus butanolivorans TaxID=421767 RepID=UPI00363A746B